MTLAVLAGCGGQSPSGEGPVGTFWRFDIKKRERATTVAPADIRTVVANPVFLTD